MSLTESFVPADTSVALVDHTVGSLLAERAHTHAGRAALVGTRHGDGEVLRLTFDELYREAQHVATAISRLAEPGEFVALWAPNVVEWPIIEYGAALAGVVLVALNPVLRQSELEYALEHSRASVLIHAESSRDYDMAAVVAALDLPDLRTISLSETSVWRSDHVDEGVIDAAPTDADAAVMLQYTSGTTGNPKGVLLRHRSLVNVARLTMEFVDIEPGATAVNPLPMFHTAACVIGTLGPLWNGGAVVLIEQFVPNVVLDTMRREEVDLLFYVPAVLGALIEAQRGSEAEPPRIAKAIGGASNVSPTMIEAAEQLFGASVINLFGQTELSPVLSATRPGDSRDDQLETVGHPLPQVDCKIVDPLTGEITALGVAGEICARGYQQLIEYLHDPQATAAAVDADGFVHTGDLGSMDERGYITLTGRLKEIIIRGGENIAPAEIEMRLVGHEAVLEASVVGLPDERLGEILGAVVRLRGEEPADLRDSLIAYARLHLSPHKVPARWFVADSMPVTPTGKVRKFALADEVVAGKIRELI